MPRTTRKKPIEKTHVDTALEEIYLEADGSVPDMHHIEHHKGKPGMVITFFILLFMAAAAAAAWFGFFLFSPNQKFSEEQIVIEIKAPEKIVAGQAGDYELSIKNTGSLALATSDATLTLPDGFIIAASEPKATDEKNDHWLIGAIDANETKTIKFQGIDTADPTVVSTLRALISFRPENFNADFQKTYTKDVAAAAAAIELTAETKSADAKQTINIKYKNISGAPISDSRLTITLASGFKIEKTIPAGQIKENVIELSIPQIDAGQEAVVQVFGTAPADNNAPVQAKLEKTIGNQTILLAEIKKTETTAATDQAQPLSLQTDTGLTSVALNPGDAFDLVMTFTNPTDQEIKNAKLVLVAEAPSVKNKSVFDFSDLKTSGDPEIIGKQISPDVRRATITWDASTLADLKSVAAGKSVSVKAHVTLKTGTQIEGVPKNNGATFTVSLNGTTANFTAPPFTTTLLSDLSIKSKAELLDPSVTGQMALATDEVGYELKLTASNSWHDLENVTIRVPIFSSLKIQSKEASSGTVNSDDKNIVTWTITKWPTSIKDQTLVLRVVAKKTAVQTAFSEKISGSATDTSSQKTISLIGAAIAK